MLGDEIRMSGNMKLNRLKLAIVDSGFDKSKIENVSKVYNYTMQV